MQDMMPPEASVIEARTQAIGRELFRLAREHHAHLTTLNRWTRQVLQWCLADAAVKVRVLRFIDVLPSLRTPEAIVRHLHDYFPTHELRLPPALRLGVSLSRPGLVTASATAALVHQLIEHAAKQFIAGETVEEARTVGQRFASHGVLVSFDVLGERVVSEREADEYAARYAALIGIAPHLSIKPSSLSSRFDPVSSAISVDRAVTRLRPLVSSAINTDTALTLDMEQYALRDLTLELAKRLLLEPGFERLHLGIVIQAYLRDAATVVEELTRWLRQHRRRLSVRVVKGAYWDYEVATSRQRGWASPVYDEKWQTDHAFEQVTTQLLAASDCCDVAIGSHNVRSLAHAMAVAEALGVPKARLEIQVLYGMGEVIQEAVQSLGCPVRVYAPIGALIPGMAYLVRRILENTANESFLRQELWDEVSMERQLAPPQAVSVRAAPVARVQGEEGEEPFADFSIRAQREQFARALDEARRALGARCPLLIGADAVETDRWDRSVNPAHPEQVVGEVARGRVSDVERAVALAAEAQPRWASTPVTERVRLLRQAAELLRARRSWLAALEVYEVGKPWREADADVVEAIEYLDYYSARMLELAAGKLLPQRPGESNTYRYRPRGVAAVIAPWNFPLAILTSMASAALVSGNAVILKPAEQSPVLAYQLTRLLREAGISEGVVQFVPGVGEEVGQALVRHPLVRQILFTGSRTVGLSILEAAATVTPGQSFVKHVVLEMGGKNAIIVDDDADLDAAIQGIVLSAFGYQGQKCSAASRLIVHRDRAKELIDRLRDAMDSLIVADPADPICDVGPLIDQAAVERVTRAITESCRSATLRYQSPPDRMPHEGYYVAPTLFDDVEPTSPLAQEELFGPVLACMTVRDFDEALAVANATAYGLTGGVYSRSPSHIRQAIKLFEVGNLYINRPITGALVGRQPFGGSKLSGLGTKAGGPDYLLQLVVPQTICENTARHGMPLE